MTVCHAVRKQCFSGVYGVTPESHSEICSKANEARYGLLLVTKALWRPDLPFLFCAVVGWHVLV